MGNAARGERNKILKRDYDLLSKAREIKGRKSILNSKSDAFTERQLLPSEAIRSYDE